MSGEVYAGPYTFGTREECGAGSTPITMSPANLVSTIPINSQNTSIAPMTFLTPWMGDTTGILVKGYDECEDRYWYNPQIAGISTWAVAENSPTSLTINSDGINYPIYSTNVPEFGYIVQVKDTGSSEPHRIITMEPSKLWSRGTNFFYFADPFSRNVNAKMRLVSLKEIQPGKYNIIGQKFGDVLMTNQENRYDDTYRYMFSVPISYNNFSVTLNTTTCHVSTQTANQIITMPTTSVESFNGVGSTAAKANFAMTLYCDSGIAVYASLTDTNNINNQTDILTLSADSAASGLGIQVMSGDDNIPKKFGPPPSGIGADNQWFIGGKGTAGDVTYNIPFSAQYIQTENRIKGGALSAQMLVTFSYE